MTSYVEVEGLDTYYFEDSYVLRINATPGRLVFEMEFVLTSAHPQYAPARRGEQYCYRRGRLEFREVTDLVWTGQGLRPAHDASGQLDYGNIDSFFIEDHLYRLFGDFGEISVTASAVEVMLE